MLPDRGVGLEGVDEVAAGVEGLATVRRRMATERDDVRYEALATEFDGLRGEVAATERRLDSLRRTAGTGSDAEQAVESALAGGPL